MNTELKEDNMEFNFDNAWNTEKADPIGDIKRARENLENALFAPSKEEIEWQKHNTELFFKLWNRLSITEKNQFKIDILFDGDNNYILEEE